MSEETTEFSRVPDMPGYYISSNAPHSGEFMPVAAYEKLKRQRDALLEALQESIGIIDCLRDYVCEGGSIRLVGAVDSVREANDFMEGKARAAIAACESKPRIYFQR